MKKVISIVLASLMLLPVIAMSGCACDNGYGKMRQESGGK